MVIDQAQPANNVAKAFGIESEELAFLIRAGYPYYEQGRLKQAQALFEGISMLDNSNAYVYGILGSIYQKQQMYNEAVACCSRTLDLVPEDIYALTNRGEVYLCQGKLVEAAHDFESAIRLDTKGSHPAANRARYLAMLAQDALILANDKHKES